ncbi:putative reverse transcriptase domain-containing protein [Tanacetum coccineum]
MPIESNKPPDPLFDELCCLTNMTSADEICEASLKDTKVRVMKIKQRKPNRGIKISTPGSAGAGSVLRRLRSAKVAGKARGRDEGSPSDNRGGKRLDSTPMNPEISKVLFDLRSGSLDSSFKFAMGCSNGDNSSVCSLNNVVYSNESCKGNDGSFINFPLESNPSIDKQSSPVAKGCGLKISQEHTGMGDEGNTSCGTTSSKDGIASAETGNLNERGMAGSGISVEHSSMEGVVNTGVAQAGSQDGIASHKGGSGFEFGKIGNGKGILKNPVGPLFNVQFGKINNSNPFAKKSVISNEDTWKMDGFKASGSSMLSNQFSADVDRFAEKLKKGSEEMALKMDYVPSSVSKCENGNRRISFSAEEVYKGGQACSLQLYGHFVGISMDYRVVRGNLMRMWRVYDIEDITKTNSGIYYFKFKSEEGMKRVLESGPWMVQNVPLVLNIWEPGIWLEKTEPSFIPIWVCVYNIPMELCNGNGIGKIMSGVGKPLLMDKMTKERCLKKSGKMDFARVLVEVSAEEELPNVLEIAYPPLGNRPARVGRLEVKYQWRPPLCTHCKSFGHTTLSCKIRPRTEEEIAAKAIKEAIKVKDQAAVDKEDGFTTVGRKNRPVETHQKDGIDGKFTFKGGNMYGNQFSGGKQRQNYNKQVGNGAGNFRRNVQQNNSGFRQMNNQGGAKFNSGGNGKRSNVVVQSMKNVINNSGNKSVQGSFVKNPAVNSVSKSLNQTSKDPNFKPKVLVRGSGSINVSNLVPDETIPVKNAFSVLRNEDAELEERGDINVNEEFESKVWPALKEEVDVLMEAGIYPSKSVRLDWTIHQIDYFYKNCHKYHLDPFWEDSEGDVESDSEGIADDMKPEFDVNAEESLDINAAGKENVSNDD